MDQTVNKKPQVYFIGVGAQKAATSWIARILDEHPSICVAEGKETHFFSKDEKYEQGVDLYAKYFSQCSPKKYIGEFSTSYLASEKAPDRIKKWFPDARIIISLRDPVTRALSHIAHLKAKKVIPQNISAWEAVEKHPEIIAHGMYGKHVTRYLDTFPKDHIHIVWYSDIMGEPEKVIKQLYTFLKIDPLFTPQGMHARLNTASARNTSMFRTVNRVHLFLRRYEWGKKVNSALRAVGIRGSSVNIGKSRPPDYSKEDYEFLAGIYKEDNASLESLLGKSFDIEYEKSR